MALGGSLFGPFPVDLPVWRIYAHVGPAWLKNKYYPPGVGTLDSRTKPNVALHYVWLGTHLGPRGTQKIRCSASVPYACLSLGDPPNWWFSSWSPFEAKKRAEKDTPIFAYKIKHVWRRPSVLK